MLFDGDCSFCRTWINWWRKKTKGQVAFRPYQKAVEDFPQVSEAEAKKAVQFIESDGKVTSGAQAVFRMLAISGSGTWNWMYDNIPGFGWVSESVYQLVARNRSTAYSLMGLGTASSSFVFSSWLFLKILGIVYLIAFASFGVQAFGLIGKDGILPVSRYMAQVKATLAESWVTQVPTLFGFSAGDWMIQLIIIAGIICSVSLIIGFLPRVALVALFVLYLSVVNGGQMFFSFQWDILLLEAGFLAIFLTPSSNIAVWVFWWLLAKVMLMSGAVKFMSSGETWENLTAMNYHFFTQPIPNVGGYLAHQLPAWVHKIGTAGVLVIELGCAALLGLSRKFRFAGAVGITLLQVIIALTGNYTFFNILTAGIALMVFDDALWQSVLPTGWVDTVTTGVQSVGLGWPIGGVAAVTSASVGVWLGWLAVGVGVAYLVLSGFQAAQMLTRFNPPNVIQKSLQSVKPFHITNTYGLFANMTTQRPEITIEGSRDGENWEAYKFRYKPNGPKDAPPQVAPHQPRLDWQMWFAALRDRPPAWFQNFAVRLLEGSKSVTDLLAHNPFPDKPPRHIRARVQNYEFTDFQTWWQTDNFWQVSELHSYMSSISVER